MSKIKLHRAKEFKGISENELNSFKNFQKVVDMQKVYSYEAIKKPLYKKPLVLSLMVVILVLLLLVLWEEKKETPQIPSPKQDNKSTSLPTSITESQEPRITPTNRNTGIDSVPTNLPSTNHTVSTPLSIHNTTNNIIECSFPGGEVALEKFISKEIRYPYNAIDRPLTEYVQVFLYIDSTGKASVKKINKTNKAFIAEVYDLVEQMPLWHPKQMNNKKVSSEYPITVPFVYKESNQ